MTPFTYARHHSDGYELSTRGDSRFSALVARMPDGRTIEAHYQCDVKGYNPGGRNWQAGKGKPSLRPVDQWVEYLALWQRWARENPGLIEDLRVKAAGRVLTDRFATSQVNQARALAHILNETAS